MRLGRVIMIDPNCRHVLYGPITFMLKLSTFPGDLKDEVSVLSWLLDDNNRELDDAIESVNFKMLEKLLDTSPFMAVFFCEFRYHVFL